MMEPDDTSPAAREAQLSLLRKMSNAQRADLALRLSSDAIALSRRAIQRANPEWSDFEVKVEWARLHYGEDVASMIRRWVERQNIE